MRAALAIAVGLLISGTACAEPVAAATPAGGFVETDQPLQVAQVTTRSGPATAQRASVPRTTGTGLAGIPTGGAVLGMSPGMAALLGIVVIGGVVAIVANDDDEPAPSGPTGSGGT